MEILCDACCRHAAGPDNQSENTQYVECVTIRLSTCLIGLYINMIQRTALGLFYGFIFIFMLAGCSGRSVLKDKPPSIQRLILMNNSDITLTDVQIYVVKTRELVSCGVIFPRTECSTGFPARDYQGNRFNVTWTAKQSAKVARDILAEVPNDLAPGEKVNAVITFHGNGRFSAGLFPSSNEDAAK